MKKNGFSVVPDGVSLDGSYLALPARVSVSGGTLTVRSVFGGKTRTVDLASVILTEEHAGVFGISPDDTLRVRDGTYDLHIHFRRRFIGGRRRYERFIAVVRANGGEI